MSEDCHNSNNDSNFQFDYNANELGVPVSSPGPTVSFTDVDVNFLKAMRIDIETKDPR